jgi:broad specificity phosphatase PhoE
MKYLILVKHSLPEILEGIPAGAWNLSEEGVRLARVLADTLRSYQPEVILTSMEPKAVQTAEIVADTLELEMKLAANLHEHERSKTPFLAQEVFESKIQEFFEKPDKLVVGNETANQAHDRFQHAVHSLVKRHGDRTIVIVAHGTVISLFVSRLTGVPVFPLWKELGLPSYIVLDRQSHTIVARENIA